MSRQTFNWVIVICDGASLPEIVGTYANADQAQSVAKKLMKKHGFDRMHTKMYIEPIKSVEDYEHFWERGVITPYSDT